MADLIPSSVKKNLENRCKKAVKKIGKIAPGEKNEKKLAGLLNEHVCKEVKNVDKKILKAVAEKLVEVAKKKSAKAPAGTIPNIKAIPKLKPPGGNVPSITIPLKTLLLNEKLGTTAKFELKIWGDPRKLQKSEKGVMLYFTVKRW